MAQERFSKAYMKMKEEKAQAQFEEDAIRRFRESALNTEKQRAALVAALPTPPPDPIALHLSGKACSTSACPICACKYNVMLVFNFTSISMPIILSLF